jgi:hypothetical protein
MLEATNYTEIDGEIWATSEFYSKFFEVSISTIEKYTK